MVRIPYPQGLIPQLQSQGIIYEGEFDYWLHWQYGASLHTESGPESVTGLSLPMLYIRFEDERRALEFVLRHG